MESTLLHSNNDTDHSQWNNHIVIVPNLMHSESLKINTFQIVMDRTVACPWTPSVRGHPATYQPPISDLELKYSPKCKPLTSQ